MFLGYLISMGNIYIGSNVLKWVVFWVRIGRDNYWMVTHFFPQNFLAWWKTAFSIGWCLLDRTRKSADQFQAVRVIVVAQWSSTWWSEDENLHFRLPIKFFQKTNSSKHLWIIYLIDLSSTTVSNIDSLFMLTFHAPQESRDKFSQILFEEIYLRWIPIYLQGGSKQLLLRIWILNLQNYLLFYTIRLAASKSTFWLKILAGIEICLLPHLRGADETRGNFTWFARFPNTNLEK